MSWVFRQLSVMFLLPWLLETSDPRFNHNEQTNLLLIPAEVEVGSVIYRLVASDTDFDYPLQFELLKDTSKSIVMIETLPCTKFNSVCQANVILQKKLEIGRYYDFKVIARDTKGGKCIFQSSISATNATIDENRIFPKLPTFIVVSEDTKRGTDLDYVIARKNTLNSKQVILELHKSTYFGIRQKLITNNDTQGTIFLLNRLDYEKQSMYHLTLCANNPYVDSNKDSRNIACTKIVVIVNDVQDVPPVFIQAPPVTKLDNSLFPGDVVARVKAEDGDRGNPREIRYGLISEGNPFTPFFNITDVTGEIILLKSLDEITAISHHGVPILLTVLAEEVKKTLNESEIMSSTVELAFILDERGNDPPHFENENYVSYIDENAMQGTILVFKEPYVPQVKDESMGKNGIFSLSLDNNNGTFEITPNVGERYVTFTIKVRDNTLLDYEKRKMVYFTILAEEIGPVTNLSSKANVIVYINDMNDNFPKFLQDKYEIEFAENVTANTQLVKIEAKDLDSGIYGKLRYTQIFGNLNSSLNLNPETGWITIATNSHGFDCETLQDYHFYVEVSDENGNSHGNRQTVPVSFHLTDVNDESPLFEKSLYDFVFTENKKKFTTPAFVKAIDRDVSTPNNLVNYEIINGNYVNHYNLDKNSGQLTINENVNEPEFIHDHSDVQVLAIRAYDFGVPQLSSIAQVHIYTSESRSRNMVFIVPGQKPNQQQIEQTLAAITGGQVHIQEIRLFDKNISDENLIATDMTYGDLNREKSIVFANIAYNRNSIIDLDQLKRTLTANESSKVTNSFEENTYRRYKDETSFLFWLLILLALLFLLTLISLICCCICRGCPLFIASKIQKHFRMNSVDDNISSINNDNYNRRKERNFHENYSVDPFLRVDRKSSPRRSHNDRWTVNKMRHEILSPQLSDSKTQPTQWQYNRKVVTQGNVPVITHDYDNPTYLQEDLILPNQIIDSDQDFQLHQKINRNEHSTLPIRDHILIKNGSAEILQLVTRCDSNIGQKSQAINDNSDNDLFKEVLFEKGARKRNSNHRIQNQYLETQSLPGVLISATDNADLINSRTNSNSNSNLLKNHNHLIRSDSDNGVYSSKYFEDLSNKFEDKNEKSKSKSLTTDKPYVTYNDHGKKLFKKRKGYNETKASILRRNLILNENVDIQKNIKNQKNQKIMENKSRKGFETEKGRCCQSSQEKLNGELVNKGQPQYDNDNDNDLEGNNYDSGIGMMNTLMKNLRKTNASAVDKKSVFTITYDGIQTKHIDNISLP